MSVNPTVPCAARNSTPRPFQAAPVAGTPTARDLVVDRPDAMVSVERFGEPPELNRRWVEIERTLLREGWRGPQLRN